MDVEREQYGDLDQAVGVKVCAMVVARLFRRSAWKGTEANQVRQCVETVFGRPPEGVTYHAGDQCSMWCGDWPPLVKVHGERHPRVDVEQNSTATWTKQLESKVCAMVVAQLFREVAWEGVHRANKVRQCGRTVSCRPLRV